MKKQGISLIVLVITIIVMIILAAAVVISMSNNGIIEKASHAVNLTDEKQVQDLAALVWAEAYLDESRTDSMEKVVKDELEKHGVTEDKWNITVTDTGVTVNKNSSSNGVVENKLSGKWQLNETLTQTGWASGDKPKMQAINYMLSSAGTELINKSLISYYVHKMESPGPEGVVLSYCTGISNTDSHANSLYHFTTGIDCPKWDYTAPIILDFGDTPQEVDADFYAWFVSNATVYDDSDDLGSGDE